MSQRFLDPHVLTGISGLDLIAKTVVDGFVAGLHRSPDFGFSQEFAEYRAYTPGDDLRHVDWNVFARTEDYARFVAASLFYLAIHNQRDAAGLIVFDDEVRNYIRPSTRQGQLARLLSGLELAEPNARTDFGKPMQHFQEFLRRRGMVVIVSDFYESPETIVQTIVPFRFHGNEVVLFHILDPQEIRPNFRESAVLVDLETKQHMEVTPDYANKEYRGKMDAHIAALASAARGAGMDYFLLPTDRPLDAALREYLNIRHERN
jgi:uncharacterized protein (DUF58 family)